MKTEELIARLNVRSPEELAIKATDLLPFWVSLVFVVMIAWYLARLTWLLLPGSDDSSWQPPATSAPAIQASASEDFSAIVDAHLFGTASADEVATVSENDAIDAPDTRLNLTLRAAVSDAEDRSAHAIIADGSGDEKVYFVKDSVPGGASLHRVEADRVILNRGGVLEALRLPRESGTAPPSRSSAPPRTAAASSSAAPSVQQVISQNPSSFTQIVRPQPYMPGGQLKGYRVYPGRNRQQFAALGLRPGDLVTEINGTPLTDPTQGMEIFRSLGDSSQVSVTIERNGESQNLTLDTTQLVAGDGATQ